MNDWLSLEALSRLLTNGLYVRNLYQHKIEQINFDVVLSCPQTFILPFFYECSSAPEQARKNKLGAGQSLKRKLGVCEQANVVLPLIYYIYTICTRTWKFLLRFSKTRELWSSKAAFAVTFFAAVNHNYDDKKWTLKHRNTQNGSNSTNHKSQTMTFWTQQRKLLLPKMIDGSENTNVRWLSNFRIRVFMTSAVIIRVSWRTELVKMDLVTRKRLSHWQTLRLRTDFDLCTGSLKFIRSLQEILKQNLL